MMRFLENNEIDRELWNRCVENSPYESLYGYTWFLDHLAPDWHGLVKNNYEYVFPLVPGQKYGQFYLYQPPFCQHFRIFSSWPVTTNIIREFFLHIPPEFKLWEFNFKAFDIFPNLNEVTFELSANYELPLYDSYEHLREQYRDNTRRNIRKAEHNGVNITFNGNPFTIIDLFRKNRGKQYKNIKNDDYVRLNALMHYCLEHDKGFVVSGYSADNKFCGGAFFLKSKNTITFLFSGINDIAKENNMMFSLVDKVIAKFSGSDTILDFDGSNDAGVARFYTGFGSNKTQYYNIRYNDLPFYIKFLKKIK